MKIQVFVKAEFHPTMAAQLKAGNKVLEEINSFLPSGKLELMFDNKDKDCMYLPLLDITVDRGVVETIQATIETVKELIGDENILFKFEDLNSDWKEGVPDDHREVLCMFEDEYAVSQPKYQYEVCRYQKQGRFNLEGLEKRPVLKWKDIF